MADPRERRELVLACAVLLLVVIVCYMTMQYIVVRREWRRQQRELRAAESFCGGNSAMTAPGSYMSRGVTCGTMPVIESVCGFGNGLCGGAFGVPL